MFCSGQEVSHEDVFIVTGVELTLPAQFLALLLKKSFKGFVVASFLVLGGMISPSESSTHNNANYMRRPHEKACRGRPQVIPFSPTPPLVQSPQLFVIIFF
jgi:hypothetical protein